MWWKSSARNEQSRYIEEVAGGYQRNPVENAWHQGSIEIVPGSKRRLRWRNKAGIAWNLLLGNEEGVLKTDETCPYFKSGATAFRIEQRAQKIVGFRFNGELYMRHGALLNPQQSGGLRGYISMSTQSPPSGFGYGVSFYVTVWPLIREPMAGFQIGLPSTWIIPDNRKFREALCPRGTVAREMMPERGPYYRDVFQTIEGGLGYWASTRFPSTTPKYRINGTPNGYNHEISSPGWGFGKTEALTSEQMGIAQLSNRVLIPPDGITFEHGANGAMLGNAWMVLDLIPGQNDGDEVPSGNQCWTLFLNSENFRGAVAFWIPETWSRLSRIYSTIQCRGLDARTGLMGGGAMEINTVPYFESKSNNGTVFSRIPPIQFPVDRNGETILMQDVVFYRKDSVTPSGAFDHQKAWEPSLTANPMSFDQGPARTKLMDLDKTVQTKIFRKGGHQAFGLRWCTGGPKDGEEFLCFPEYFREARSCRTAVHVTDVPVDSLTTEVFDKNSERHAYESPDSGVWTNPGHQSKLFHVSLTDGSVVTYAWYRFIDQPSIRSLGWPEPKLERLQARVEKLHDAFLGDNDYLPPLTSGRLVKIDDAVVVEPPKGFSTGYVPIVMRQAFADGKKKT